MLQNRQPKGAPGRETFLSVSFFDKSLNFCIIHILVYGIGRCGTAAILIEETMDRRILMLIPLSLFFMLSMFYRASSAVIASELVRDLSLTPQDLGLLSSVFFYAFALVQIPMGMAIDHFGPKRVMLFLSCVGLVGVVSFAFADSFFIAIMGRALTGAGMGCGLMGTLIFISIWFPPRAFATISGVLLSIGTLGSIGATAPLAFAVDWMGWRKTFLLIALVHLAITLWIFKGVEDSSGEPRSSHTTSSRSNGAIKGIAAIFLLPSFWLISLAAFVRYGTFISISGLWAGPYLEHIYLISLVDTGKMLLFFQIGYLVGSPVFGLLSDRVWKDRRTVATGAMFLYTLCVLPLVGFTPPFSLRMVAAIFFSIGFADSFTSVLYANIKELLPSSVTGTAMSAVNFFTMAGAGFFQHIMGIIIERFSIQEGQLPPEAFSFAFGLCFIAAAAGTVGYLFVKRASL
jgi:sugar phosphate permease